MRVIDYVQLTIIPSRECEGQTIVAGFLETINRIRSTESSIMTL